MECHNHKPQPFPDPKRKRKPTNLNKHKPNKRTKSTKISSLFPKRGYRNTKRKPFVLQVGKCFRSTAPTSLVLNGDGSKQCRRATVVQIFRSADLSEVHANLPMDTKKKGKRKVQGVPHSQTAALPRPQEERKPTNLNKHKPNKRTKSTKISSLFPKRGNRNTKRTEKHKNKMTHGKTYKKSPRRINHKATKSKTNTGTTALERSVEQTK